ncbi:glycosyltransferase family 2 protein [uncultured Lacinutrix sp.]|uniref:glycosyltransferase family 2 protein n=1 Tax=uncultured Lacinutrix sp. TaxID=574032 RepID=UPI00262DF3CB|nr:glycosyltransferase family A protein [uncultured Lacinutrix sp.]
MIILVHNGKTVTSVLNEVLQPIAGFELNNSIVKLLKIIAKKETNRLVVWCHDRLLDSLNIEAFSSIFHHESLLVSFNTNTDHYLPKQIGYIERSFFLKVNKKVCYPTWLMSSHVGGINTTILNDINVPLNNNVPFDYFLNSLAKNNMVEGLFCYSEPKLLKANHELKINTPKASKQMLFKFVKQHYKWVWVFLLAWNYAVFERKISVYNIIISLFYKRLNSNFNLEKVAVNSSKNVLQEKSIDVIIPTIGRKKHLYNVLKDLAHQTHLPKNVIIVEQNPKPNSISELEYLNSEVWPFNIKHEFTQQPGVCNARNIALLKIESEWAFLADDDIRFNTTFFEESFNDIKTYGIKILNYLCLQPEQEQTYFKIHQTTVFGSGSSLVKSELLENIKFNMAYEFGFGEDSDFGMQLRNKGEDVIFTPNLKITHLKAPFGGYRTKVKHLWEEEEVQPKPSPTVQLLYQTYFTKQQMLGYKLLLFLRQLKGSGLKNPVAYAKYFKKQWQQSVLWCQKIKKE